MAVAPIGGSEGRSLAHRAAGRGSGWLLVAIVGLVLALAGPAQAQRHVYVADTFNPGTIDIYEVHPDGSLNADASQFAFSNVDRPFALVPSPDGRWLFTIGNDGSITTLAVAADGSLSRRSSIAAGAYAGGGVGPVISPDGHSLYTVGANPTTLQQWTISDDGVVTSKAPTLSTPSAVPGIAMTPDGRSFYVGSSAGVQRYAVAADGSLTAAGAPVGPTGFYRSLAVSSDGRSLYGVSSSPAAIGQWDLAADGAVSPKTPGSLSSAGSSPDLIALTPFQRGVYALPIANVEQFGVGDGGALSRLTPGLIPTNGQRAIASSPDGRSLYVARIGAIAQYDVADNGLLTPKPVAAVGAGAAVDLVVQPSQGPQAALSAPATAAAGDPVPLDASASVASGGAIDRYDWDFGDGTTAADAGATPFHAFATPGTYAVSVRVTDGDGCSTGLYNGRFSLCQERGAVATRTVVVSSASADLQLTKTASAESVAAGDQFSYLLRATNAGPSDVGDATIADALPAGLRVDAIEPSQGACTNAAGNLSCRLGALRAGDSALVLVFARPDAALAGSSVVNRATVSSSLPDPDPSNDTASQAIAVTAAGAPQPDTDLVVDKTVAGDAVQVGGTVGYTIRVTNRGPQVARDATLVDGYPRDASIVDVRTSVGDCQRTPVLVCRFGDLAPGATAVVTLVTRQAEPGVVVNGAAVSSDSAERRPADNVDAVRKQVGSRRARLRLTLAAEQRSLRGGETGRFVLRVRSVGRDAAGRTAVCVRVPAGLVPVRIGGARRHDQRFCWTIARLGVGRERFFAFTARTARLRHARRVTVRARAASIDAPVAAASASVRIVPRGPVRPPRVTG